MNINKEYNITVYPYRSENYDSRDVRINEKGYGFIGRKDGRVATLKCPCGLEVPAAAALEHICPSCGFDLKHALENTALKGVYKAVANKGPE